MSWESTATYYAQINRAVKAHLGGSHSAKILLYSVDFHEIETAQHNGDWDKTAAILTDAATRLEQGGADFILICTNTMHKVAPQVQASVSIPLLHIADTTASFLKQAGIGKVGLLGTAFTMEQAFYKQHITTNFGISVITPNEADRNIIHNVIYKELCHGVIHDTSKQQYLRIITDLAKQGAQAVILGCTEIGLLVQQNDTPIRLIDTVELHTAQAVTLALSKTL